MKRLILFAAFVACVFAAPSQAVVAKPNAFGITVVRFAPGTTPAQMRAAVTAAGADVVTDLSAIDALAVVPRSTTFPLAIRAQPGVRSAFRDAVLASDRGPRDLTKALGTAGTDPGPASRYSFPDPWHDLASFWGVTNPEGILQWDDGRMNVPAAWKRTRGDGSITVGVLDTGVDASHPELKAVVDPKLGGTFIPCKQLKQILGAAGAKGLDDCSASDREGHGTWVASRIAGAANGFASNGVAPNVRIASYKVLAAGVGGLTSWIAAGLIDACSNHHVDVVNMSIVGYLDPTDPADVDDFLLWSDAISYCRAHGVPVFAAAGNEHVEVDRVHMSLGGRSLEVGRVADGPNGFATARPGSASLDDSDLRGWLEAPAGVPGATMVSSTANAIGAAPASVRFRWTQHVGARDQLAYYSNFGSRVDLAAPGGARRYEIPGFDAAEGNILYGGWGSLGALVANGLICNDPIDSSPGNSACFKVSGAEFGWLQGTSMSTPNAAGVAALALSTHPELRSNPSALVSRLESTARRSMTNFMGPNDPSNFGPAYDGTPCATGFCHVDQRHPISFAAAFGAGIVDAGAAVSR